MPSSSSTVLILPHSADFFTVDRVAAAIRRRGRTFFRFDTDRFPAQARLSDRLGPEGSSALIADEGRRREARDVRAVWARRVWEPALAADLDPSFREAARRESRAALAAAWDAFRDAGWIDRMDLVARAGDKLLQLRLAREAGLEIPRTLLTNDPEEARAFFRERNGRVVAKMLTPLTQGMDGAGAFVYTSRVTEADLAEADGLRHSPMLFQEEIPKERELRVVAVRDELFAGAVDARHTAAGAVDWRRSTPEECRWERGAVPEDCARSLRRVLGELGLAFGVFDLIHTPDGRHVFLELNPGGEWGMLERDLDLGIADALARALCED